MNEISSIRVIAQMAFDVIHFVLKWIVFLPYNILKLFDFRNEIISIIAIFLIIAELFMGAMMVQVWRFNDFDNLSLSAKLFFAWASLFYLSIVMNVGYVIVTSWYEKTKASLMRKANGN